MTVTLPRERRTIHLAGTPWCEIEETVTFDAAADAYEATDGFVADALQWVADSRDLPGDLVERVLQHYRESSAYTTAVEDIQAGDR